MTERFALCARWPMKSSVQSWFSGSRPYFSRYFAHCVSCGHHGATKSALPSACAIGVAENQHVAAFLDRHPLAAVIAADRERIGAQVVRRVGELPVRRGGVHQHVDQRGLGQRRAEQDPDRVHREEDVHRGDVAVAGVFLGEEQRLLVRVGGQAVGGDALAIGQRGDLRVLLAAQPASGRP